MSSKRDVQHGLATQCRLADLVQSTVGFADKNFTDKRRRGNFFKKAPTLPSNIRNNKKNAVGAIPGSRFLKKCIFHDRSRITFLFEVRSALGQKQAHKSLYDENVENIQPSFYGPRFGKFQTQHSARTRNTENKKPMNKKWRGAKQESSEFELSAFRKQGAIYGRGETF